MKKQIAKIKQYVSEHKDAFIIAGATIAAAGVVAKVVHESGSPEHLYARRPWLEDPEVVKAFDNLNAAAKELDDTIAMAKYEYENPIN